MLLDKASKDECGWKDFGHIGYKDVRFKFEVANDGFGYFVCENHEKSTVRCDITLNFRNTVNIKILGKYTGMTQPTIEVYSSEAEIIVYEILDYPSYAQFSYSSVCINYTTSWLEWVIKSSSSTYYPFQSKDVGIYKYVKKQDDSILYIYKNTSTDYKFVETVQYHMIGCNDYTNSRDGRVVELMPGQMKYTQLFYDSSKTSTSGDVLKSIYRVIPIVTH